MDLRKWLGSWPVIRQLQQGDSLGLGKAAQSPRSAALEPRTATADRMARSVCPYCAVGCGQRVFVKDEQVIQIEGDPDSPVSRGRLCPKGAASKQLVTGPNRETKVKYRRPHGSEWEELDLETAMDMIADRVIATRGRPGRTSRATRSTGAPSALPAWAGRPSTTRRTTSSRSCSPRSGRSRSRTRRGYDTAPPSPVWGSRSAAAAPPPTRVTSSTRTAS
jgi:formate dehydrogenase major subunit